ncbi:MAG: sugar isomerase domain-containing protein, partial [Bdellovibrionia bacterium]
MKKKTLGIDLRSYSKIALPHLEAVLEKNLQVMERLTGQLVRDIKVKKSLFIFGSGHSAILPLELYHRAGGPSFIIPLVADYLLPTAGPPVVRLLERIPGSAQFLLDRAQPRPGEMIWLVSQSGINSAVVDLALEANKRKLRTVAFTCVAHSQAVPARHPSGKKLFEICSEVVDWGGVVGDAALKISKAVSVGPLSTLSGIFLAHSIL